MDATAATHPDVDARLQSARTLCELFQATAAERADEIALRTPGGAQELTWRQYAQHVELIASGLHGLGVRRGDAVALMMFNRPEFALVDVAAMHLGATPFSVYNTFPAEVIGHLMTNAGARVAICEPEFAERLLAAPGIEHVVCVEPHVPGTISLEELQARPSEDYDHEAAWRALDGEDILTLIYTSGTTGFPKGVEITHDNMLAELRATATALPTKAGGRTVSYLPSAHIADRWATLYLGYTHGLTITYCADATKMAATVVEVHPTAWGGVPRVFEKMRAGLQAALAADPDEARRAAVAGAIDVALQVVRLQQAGEPVPAELAAAHAQADERVLAPLRARLGLDQCEWVVVGAAPSPRDLLEFFAALGLTPLEVWGMSELTCVTTSNTTDAVRLGTVGKPIEGVEVAIADDGEVIVRGPTVMRGYRGEPEKTAETIDAERWLHTGDIGEFDQDGYLRIVDRKKELIINAAGKNMSPANIESALKSAGGLIGQAVCVGDRRPYNVALIVLDPDAASTWARERGMQGVGPAQLTEHEALRAEVAASVERANEQLSRVEQIKRFALLPSEWMPGGDELTPTMKLKRKPIAEKYAEQIDALYG
ncbi:MAG TPA: AMP-dependent synthetase/ligase [Solirubrobacteraceae bacterium]|jgi:long-subunit acyl-CoA synthetase (AMP-forming)|nr:AMP-dependent synthetase/ligase [Solirubrobacteraceae bacterium]